MGFGNPQVPWIELEQRLSDRGPDGRAPGSPPWTNAGGDSPAWSRKRQPYRPPPQFERPSDAVPYAELHCHSNFSFLDGAIASRRAGRGSGATRSRGAGAHRPRRLLRRGPLRRGGARRSACRRCSAPSSPSVATSPSNGVADPEGHHLSCSPPDRSGLRPAGSRDQPGADGGREGRCRTSLAQLADASAGTSGQPTGDWLGAHRMSQGHGARGPRARTVPPPRHASCSVSSTRSAATTCRGRAVGSRRSARLGPQRRARRDRRPRRCRRASPPTTCTTRRRRVVRWPPRWPRCGRGASLDEIDGWLPAAAAAHLRSGAEQARRFARYPGVRRARGRARPRVRVRPRARRAQPAAVPVPARPRRDELAAAAHVTRARSGATDRARATHRPSVPYAQIDHELAVIEQLGFPGYFLIVWDIVEFCRAHEHLLPGAGLGRQQRGLLRARHHQRRRGGARPAVRAVPLARARRPARHRHRHRERPARGGDPVRLRALRPRARRPGRQRHHVPGEVVGARHGQGARLTPPASRTRGPSRSTAWGPLDSDDQQHSPSHDIPAAGARAWRRRSSTSRATSASTRAAW